MSYETAVMSQVEWEVCFQGNLVSENLIQEANFFYFLFYIGV